MEANQAQQPLDLPKESSPMNPPQQQQPTTRPIMQNQQVFVAPQAQQPLLAMNRQDNSKCRMPVRVVLFLDAMVAVAGCFLWVYGAVFMYVGITSLKFKEKPVSDLLYFSYVWSILLFICNVIEVASSILLARTINVPWAPARKLKKVYIWFGFNIFLMVLSVVGGAFGAPPPDVREINSNEPVDYLKPTKSYLELNIYFAVGNFTLVIPRIVFYCIVFQYVIELRDAVKLEKMGRGAGV